MITIRSHDSSRVAVLYRDVSVLHPVWVHEQLGTNNEVELQQVLDSLNILDFEETDFSRDADGVLISEEETS